MTFAWAFSAIRQRTFENEVRIRIDSSTMFELEGPEVAGMQRLQSVVAGGETSGLGQLQTLRLGWRIRFHPTT